MTDQQAIDPDENKTEPTIGLTEELGDLGKNLVGILRAAWDRPERQKLQQEIEGGLSELGNTLRREAKAVSENPVSQKIRTEVGDLGSRVRSGEVEGKVRDEMVSALHIVNLELEKLAGILAVSEAESTSEENTTSVDFAAVSNISEAETPGEMSEINQPHAEGTAEPSSIEPTGPAVEGQEADATPTTDQPAEE